MKKELTNRLPVDILVLAAGRGTRMNSDINKMFKKIKGVPVLYRTLYRLNRVSCIARIIVVIREEEQADYLDMIRVYGELEKVKEIVNGGRERNDSVNSGLGFIQQNPGSEIIMTHDGARPFVTERLVERLVERVDADTIVIPVIKVNETVRKKNQDGSTCTIDRDTLFITQTPQAFKVESIGPCFLSDQQRNISKTDEAGYFENMGLAVTMVEGEKWNIKITSKEDLDWSEFLLNRYDHLRINSFDRPSL
ncbi:2-C-methyl-D-erythritol 4-phosphate cytidylyltransferase [bacterium]|nr:2-C-methyl-D-erythritol 4-phosphate cytidylyltransferase [bacterium]